MKLQRLYSLARKAIDKYNMIEEGDKIAIGVSGGKDSLTLLYALAGLRHFYPKKFTVCAIQIGLGYDNKDFDVSNIKKLCEELGVEYSFINSQIGEIVMEARKESNPCSLCAKLRKGALNKEALRLGCNKVAYGHHKDDYVETMVMSLLYEGRFYAFPPVTYLDRTKLTVIRPLMFIDEKDIKGFNNEMKLPVLKNPCPVDGHTKREYVKNVVKTLNYENVGAKERMFSAIINGNISDWIEAKQ